MRTVPPYRKHRSPGSRGIPMINALMTPDGIVATVMVLLSVVSLILSLVFLRHYK